MKIVFSFVSNEGNIDIEKYFSDESISDAQKK